MQANDNSTTAPAPAKRIRKRPVKAQQQSALPVPTISVIDALPDVPMQDATTPLPLTESQSMSYISPGGTPASDSQKESEKEAITVGTFEEVQVRKTPSTMIVTPIEKLVQNRLDLPQSLIEKSFRDMLQADTKKAIQEAIAAILLEQQAKRQQKQEERKKNKRVTIKEKLHEQEYDGSNSYGSEYEMEDDDGEEEEQIDTSSLKKKKTGPLQYAANQYEQQVEADRVMRQFHAPIKLPPSVLQQRTQRRLAIQQAALQPPRPIVGNPLQTPSRFAQQQTNKRINSSSFYNQ